jgi:hypothetical protein
MFDYLGRLGTAPEEAGVAVLAPNSRDNTWDAIAASHLVTLKTKRPEMKTSEIA